MADNWVLVCVGLDQDLAGLVVLDEPCPATALDACKRCVELALEVSERAVRILDSGLSQVVSRCYIHCEHFSLTWGCAIGGQNKLTLSAPDGSPPPP